MKRLILLGVISFTSISLVPAQGPVTISISFVELKSDTIVRQKIHPTREDLCFQDTLIAKNKTVRFTDEIDDVVFYALIPQESFIKRNSGVFYVPSGNFIELLGIPNETVNIKSNITPRYVYNEITGSPINEAYTKVKATYQQSVIAADSIELTRDSLSLIDAERANKLFTKCKRNTKTNSPLFKLLVKMNWKM